MSWGTFTGGGGNFYHSFFEQFTQVDPEPDLIECVITGPAGGTFKTYLQPDELEELQGRYNRINRVRAENERKIREAAEAARSMGEQFRRFSFPNNGFFFTGSDDGYRSTPSTPEPKTVPPSRLSDARWRELCELAGAPVKTELTQKQLYRRAMRKCHPDTGGSHELWIRLDKLKAYLSL